MTPGVQYRFVDINPLEGVLSLEQTLYSEVEALKFKDYRDIFREQGLPVPYGPIAPVLLITTFNGWLLASERSTDTNKFPGSEWGFGGDVDNPSKNIGEHLVFVEKRQELHSKKGEATYETVGIIFDEVLHKHDLVVHATYREGPNNIKKGDRLLPDVANINIHSVREDDLANYLVDSYVHSLDHANQAWIGKPSSAFSADILLFGWQKYGSLWADAVMDKINAKIAELPEPMEVPWQEY